MIMIMIIIIIIIIIIIMKACGLSMSQITVVFCTL